MSKVFIVLGMHGSATSLVSKALHTQIYMGPNPRPNVFESRPFRILNSRILRAAGGSWSKPPPLDAILAQGDRFARYIKHVVSGERKDIWGWKDPRTTLTIRLYLPYLENPHFICIFRTPLEVAKNMQKRHGMSLEDGIRLANIYNRRLLDFLELPELNYRGTADVESS